jgi:hypothetical protein
MMRATNFRATCGVRVAGIFNSISIACAGKTSYLRVIFPDLRVYDIFFSHISATKMMFWALARVSFRAAKIVSCNKNFFFMVYDQNYHNCSTLGGRDSTHYIALTRTMPKLQQTFDLILRMKMAILIFLPSRQRRYGYLYDR